VSNWPASKARRVLAALLRLGWAIKRQSGSHRTLAREGWPDIVFAIHDDEEIGPRMLARLSKHTGFRPEDLQASDCSPWSAQWRPGEPRRRDARILPQKFAALGSTRLLGSRSSATLPRMTIKARVQAGRLVVDEPTTLPEGTEVELLPLDPGDWLTDADRQALHAALAESEADVAAGRLVDAAEVLKELRSR
jgi:predicted RNA binding protein YcfA (HicA-like mRNA interferase family)